VSASDDVDEAEDISVVGDTAAVDEVVSDSAIYNNYKIKDCRTSYSHLIASTACQ